MIPSNATVKEFAKYYIANATTQEIEEQFYKLLDELEEARAQLLSKEKRQEVLEEQLSFARDLVTNINEQAVISRKEARKNSKEWGLANYIVCQVEESYFEI